MGATLTTKEIQRALRTLAPDQGRIARRNARKRVKRAIAKLLREMNAEFPAVRLPRADRPRRRKSKWSVVVPVTNNNIIARCSEAGIRARLDDNNAVVLPEWAVTIATHRPKQLVESKKSIPARKAAIAAIHLGGS